MPKRISLDEAHRITSEGASFRRPAWSPDGRHLIVESAERGGSLYLCDARGRLHGWLLDGAEAAFSPDGARLAFTRVGADGRREVWVCDISAPDRARRIAGGDGAAWEHPCWSPDGAGIACASDAGNHGGVRNLWLCDPVRGERQRITSDPQRCDGHPSFSPDGRSCAFDADDRADDAREIDVYVLELGAGFSSATCLTDGTVATRRPCFIDPRHLLAERRSVAGPTLVVIDRERRRTLPVGDQPDGEREPSVRLRTRGRDKRPRVQVAYVRREHDRDAVWTAELCGLKLQTPEEVAEEAIRAAAIEAARVHAAGEAAAALAELEREHGLPPAPSGDEGWGGEGGADR